MGRFVSNSTFLVIAANFVGLIFFEVLTRIIAYHGLIAFRYYPTSKQRVLADLNPHFGTWRYANRKTRHQGACFNVSYETNSLGMRDRERVLNARGRARHVVLGDSFVEGFGVEATKRFTEVLEDSTSTEFLNFGVSGDFSSTQQYLLYRELASSFAHDAVSIFFLPDNDFRDNDPAYSEPDRYRPYLRKKEGSEEFEIFYTVSFALRDKEQEMSWRRQLRRTLYNNVYLFNAARQLGDAFENSELKNRLSDVILERQESSYERYSKEDLAKLAWGYRQIAELAHPRPVFVFIIPREVDFVVLDAPRAYESIRLIDDLRALTGTQKNVQVHDLLPHFKERLKQDNRDYDEVFLPCDGHWSSYGHEVVAGVYKQILRRTEM